MDGATNKHQWPAKVEERLGMPVRVIRLRNKGRRITRQEMLDSTPLEGLLVFEHVGLGACVRYRSSASLRRTDYAGSVNVCKPLFEPTMERLDADGLILKGHENETVNGALVQYVQVWLCVPILPGANAAGT